jgi:hypothetical protein
VHILFINLLILVLNWFPRAPKSPSYFELWSELRRPQPPYRMWHTKVKRVQPIFPTKYSQYMRTTSILTRYQKMRFWYLSAEWCRHRLRRSTSLVAAHLSPLRCFWVQTDFNCVSKTMYLQHKPTMRQDFLWVNDCSISHCGPIVFQYTLGLQ